MTRKTITNPSTPGKVEKFLVQYEDGTSKEIFGVGPTNAWFLSMNIWPNSKISAINAID
jgi:hypothetical protein